MISDDASADHMKKKFDDICEECKKSEESVQSNLIMLGYKICDSCKISKTIFTI